MSADDQTVVGRLDIDPMKNLLKSSVIALSLVMSSGLLASAQTPEPAPAAPATEQHHRHNPARETKMLTKKLSLSPEQAAQVQPILTDRQARMDALKTSTPADPQARRQQIKAIMQDTEQKLDAVLNDQQKQQFSEMKSERRHKHHEQTAPEAAPSL